MKKNNRLMEMLAVSLCLGFGAQAQEVRNGGGEDGVFKSIRDEIKVWVDKNARLEKLSQKLGVDQPEVFREKLEQAMARVGDRVIFNRREIRIAGNVRICENNPVTATITCNVDAWNQSRGDTRYMIVLHEYLGIAGLESNSAEYSRYPISPKLLSYVHAREAFELGMEKVALTARSDDRDRDLEEIFSRDTQKSIADHLKSKYQLPLQFLTPPKLEGVDLEKETRAYAFTFFREIEFESFGVECSLKLDIQTAYPARDQRVANQTMQKTSEDQTLEQRRQMFEKMFGKLLKMDQSLIYASDEFSRTMVNQIAGACIDDDTFNELVHLPVRSPYARNLISALQSGSWNQGELNNSEMKDLQRIVQQISQRRQQLQQQMQQVQQATEQQSQQLHQQRQQQQAQAEPIEVASRLIRMDSTCLFIRTKAGARSFNEVRTKNSELFKFAQKHHLFESTDYEWDAR